ncbi:Os02g0699812 [Oryza sativa Japonica Group]|uniref:Os02g0699812 protein n=1 Tax=Oryza sativa subsp. japonica TaxID=39947 RepID=A0A0P0VNG8_ORYSJ|nr:Os02g0699812 [Oryza sativa Japonica Group]
MVKPAPVGASWRPWRPGQPRRPKTSTFPSHLVKAPNLDSNVSTPAAASAAVDTLPLPLNPNVSCLNAPLPFGNRTEANGTGLMDLAGTPFAFSGRNTLMAVGCSKHNHLRHRVPGQLRRHR